MTRFARAKGSKSSNERLPEKATSWVEMKQQLEQKKQEIELNKQLQEANAKREANYKAFLEEQEQETLKQTKWADFPGVPAAVKPKQNKKKQAKKVVDEDDDLDEYMQGDDSDDDEFSGLKAQLDDILDKKENGLKVQQKQENDSDSDAPPEEATAKTETKEVVVKKAKVPKKKLLKIVTDPVKNKKTTAIKKLDENMETNEETTTKKVKTVKKETTADEEDKKELTEAEQRKIEKKKERRLKQLQKKKLVREELRKQKQAEAEKNGVPEENKSDKKTGVDEKNTGKAKKKAVKRKAEGAPENEVKKPKIKKSPEELTDVEKAKIEKKKARKLKQLELRKKKKAELKAQKELQSEEAKMENGAETAPQQWTPRQPQEQQPQKKFPDKPFNNNNKFNNNSNNNNSKPGKVRDKQEHARKKPFLPTKMMINGKEVEVDYIEGFPVKKEDAERLKKLRKEMISKGLPRSEINVALKLERRKAEKAFAREKKKVCFNCRRSGHNLSECPDLDKNQVAQTAGSGICFKCGSTEHTHFECKVVRGQEFKFASCFICNEQGHIARQCPDNARGLYPKGGACNVCGDVTHLKRDCPQYQQQQQKQSDEVHLETLSGDNPDVLHNQNHNNSWSNKPKMNKIIKF